MDNAPKVLVTGANGFIGSALTQALLEAGVAVRITGQKWAPELVERGAEWFPMADLTEGPDWASALEGVTAVVHLAGLAHVVGREQWEKSELFDRVNHLPTRALARAIRTTPSVERFLFMSSVAVHGIPAQFPLRAEDPVAPSTPYGASKWAGEEAIRELLADAACHWAIFRPVVVYGPGNPGNMARLEGLIRRRVPIPVGSRPNRRSFLFLGNMVAAIQAYLDRRDGPSGATWLLADSEPCSTEVLTRTMAASMGIPAQVWRIPEPLLDWATTLGDVIWRLGLPSPWTREVRDKLLGDYYVDCTPIQRDLGWTPPFSLAQGLALTYRRP